MASVVKNPPANAGDPGLISGSRRTPAGGHGNHSSILAGRIPWTEGPGRLQSIESQRVRHNRSDLGRTQSERYNGLKGKFTKSLPLALIFYPLEDCSKRARHRRGRSSSTASGARLSVTPAPVVPPHTWALGPETGLGTQTHQNWRLQLDGWSRSGQYIFMSGKRSCT